MVDNYKICFIPDIPYLADQVYLNLADELKSKPIKVHLNYVHTVTNTKLHRASKLDKIRSRFDSVNIFEVDHPESLAGLRKRKRYFLNAVRGCDSLVFITDKSYEYRLARQFLSNVQRHVLQPATRFYSTSTSGNWKRKLVYYAYTFIGLPLVKKPGTLGFDDPKAKYYYWSNFWMPPYLKEKQLKCIEVGPIPFQRKDVSKPTIDCQVAVILSKRLSLPPDDFDAIISLIRLLIKGQPQVDFVIKVHPNEELKFFEDYFNECKNAVVHQKIDGSALVKYAKCVVSPWSTLVYEALYYNTAVIFINPDSRFDISKKIPGDYPFIASDENEAAVHLTQILEQNSDTLSNLRSHTKRVVGASNLNGYQIIAKSVLNDYSENRVSL